VAVNFEKIEQQFHEIFGFIQQDLCRIVQVEPGVNYAAAALITCACEVMAFYKYGKQHFGESVFEILLPKGDHRGRAKTLYNALRNGLIHGYYPKDIQFNGSQVELEIAWRETPHLSVKQVAGKLRLTLNVRNLCERLSDEINQYCIELQSDPDARDRFWNQYQKGKELTVNSPKEVDVWKKLLR
jgi:hypothetical protein